MDLRFNQKVLSKSIFHACQNTFIYFLESSSKN